MGKGLGGGAAAIVVVIVLGWGLLTGDLDVGRVLDGVLSEAPGASSSGSSGSGSGSGPSTAQGAPAPPSKAEARSRLGGIAVEPAGSMAGYSREAFPHWAADGTAYGWPDTEGSCDVRDEALIRDAAPPGVAVDEDCSISSGSWTDPFSGAVTSDPGQMDIDHLVPLANAWRSGASAWSPADREAYANDPGVLLTADDGLNQEKGDKGPEAWRPPNRNYWCEYSRRWVWIKSDWGLFVNAAEKGALTDMLATCGADAGATR